MIMNWAHKIDSWIKVKHVMDVKSHERLHMYKINVQHSQTKDICTCLPHIFIVVDCDEENVIYYLGEPNIKKEKCMHIYALILYL